MEIQMRIVGYIRASTADQKITLEAQRAKIEAMAVVKGETIQEFIIDSGESAKSLERPGMQRILGMVDRRELDCVIIAKLDRITRSVRDLGTLMERFNKRQVSLVSVEESLDTGSASGRLVLNIMVSVSQWEREAIGERTKTALHYIKATGCPSGPAPYGWTAQPRPIVNGKRERVPLIPNPDEQQIIRIAHGHHLAGWTLSAIAEELNAANLTTRAGTAWNKQYVGRILTSTLDSIPVAI
jgi:DNA invertase Pin-like site-specific DNA recombinase